MTVEKEIEAVDLSHCSVCGEITTNREEVSIMLTVCKKCSKKMKKVIEK